MREYENYRDSSVMWLGKIPAHWELGRGKYFFRTRKEINGGNQCSNILSLTLDGVINNDIDNPIGLSPRDYASYQIASFLDWKITAIDKLIAIRRDELRNLAELRKALITREVTRGNWERVKLKMVARINPPCDSHGLKPEDTVTFAPMECIRTDRRIPKDGSLSNYNSSYTVFNDGDIAIASVMLVSVQVVKYTMAILLMFKLMFMLFGKPEQKKFFRMSSAAQKMTVLNGDY